jgi:hypothetical protein
LHGLVKEQHLQQRPSATFPHTDDDRLHRTTGTILLVTTVAQYVATARVRIALRNRAIDLFRVNLIFF